MLAIVLNFIWKTINYCKTLGYHQGFLTCLLLGRKKLIDILQSHISSVYFPCQTRVYHAVLV